MDSGPIVIVGALTDDHARAVYEGVLARGHEPFVLNGQDFPDTLAVSLGEAAEAIEIAGRRLGRPAAAYVRSLYLDAAGYGLDVEEAMKQDWRRTTMILRERSTALSSVLLRWNALGVPLYNPPDTRMMITKPFQLSALEAAGLPVPATLWTNDPDAVRRFCERHTAIYKPVAGGAATRKVEPHDLEPERLERLAAAPVCFQELLPGQDIRVYVLDGKILCAMKILTDAIDFRGAEQSVEAFELVPEVAEQCVRACEVLGLRFTGMDLKGDTAGRLKILELNPSPMFLGFEALAGVQIAGPLCDALVGHATRQDDGQGARA